jgi:hypothetical protein
MCVCLEKMKPFFLGMISLSASQEVLFCAEMSAVNVWVFADNLADGEIWSILCFNRWAVAPLIETIMSV